MEAESEIIAGYHTEYSGIKFGLIQAAEMAGVLAASGVMATLFLGGWTGPFMSSTLGPLWFLLKLTMIAFIFIWIRATFPRLRIDQIMAFAWKFLVPLAIINLIATAIQVYVFSTNQNGVPGIISQDELWAMAAINMIIAIISIAIFGRVTKEKVRVPPVKFGAISNSSTIWEA